MTNINEIKPCPFCGQEPDIEDHDENNYYRISCFGHCMIEGRSMENAINIWNSREGESHTLEVLAALKLLVEDVQRYEAWQRPVYALDRAKTAIAKAEGRNND